MSARAAPATAADIRFATKLPRWSRARAPRNGSIDGWDQARVDELATAAAWAIVEPARNRALAECAVRDTGLGNVDDKIAKNRRKTMGLLRDLAGAKTVGVIAEDRARGLIEIARPVGVVAAITPSTNPGATPANNIVNALKCRNAIVLAPSPKGASTLALLLQFVHAELDRIGAPRDLVLALAGAGDARAHARIDAAGRSGGRDRLAEQRARGLPERHARARCRRRQRGGDRRRKRRPERRGAQDRAVEDFRQRDELLVREQRHRGRRDRATIWSPRWNAKAACCSTRRRRGGCEQAMFTPQGLAAEVVAQSAGGDCGARRARRVPKRRARAS